MRLSETQNIAHLQGDMTMQATYTVRLRERGQVTLPQAVRRDLAVEDGDLLTLVQIDDLAVLTRRSSVLPKLSEEFTAIMKEDGVGLADLLQGLEAEREQIWRERYADHA
jgi:bifunctional DNA-binding transcriptional regulator/antitoxin component of YhaV-PrlF toxin-antitoxin module